MIQPKSDLERAEEDVPALAERATREAYERTLAAGLSVLVADPELGMIFEVFPDGRRIAVQPIAPQIAMPLGSSTLNG